MVERLLDAAGAVFLAHGYRGSSVSLLCRQAGVANGTFYQYFPDKDALLGQLLARFQGLVLAELRRAAARGHDRRGRIEAVVAALHDLLRREIGLLQLFREAEPTAGAAAAAFYTELEVELPRLLDLPGIAPALLARFVLGAVYFNVVSRGVWGLEHQPLPSLVQFVLHGMAPPHADPARWTWAVGREPLLPPAPTVDAASPPGGGEATRRRLLAAAEELFGTLGYHETTVARLTEAAGVGLGTFYLHFPGKQELLAELVHRTTRRLTALVAAAVDGVEHRLAQEVLALRAFFVFIGRHGRMYRVVQEAEFVSREIGAGYYLTLARGYERSLAQAMARGEVRSLDPLALGLALLGVGHFVGQGARDGSASPGSDPPVTATVALLMGGLLGPPRRPGPVIARGERG
jgi:AcrR family transcriptional regulator